MSIDPIRLRLPEGCDEGAVRRAVAGARFVTVDSRTVPAKFAASMGHLVCLRSLPTGGRIVVPWPVGGLGTVLLSTATVSPSEEPPELRRELARGSLAPLRDLMGTWEVEGWRPPGAVRETVRAAQREFMAVACGGDEARAGAALAAVVGAGSAVVTSYGATARLFRDTDLVERVSHAAEPGGGGEASGGNDSRADTVILESSGSGTGGSGSTRTGYAVATPWSRLEPTRGDRRWELVEDALATAAAEGRAITCGPLIDFASSVTPAWLDAAAASDREGIASLCADFVESYVGRFGVVVRRWEVVAGVASASPQPYGDEQRLLLAMHALRSASGVANGRPLAVRIADPDGRYLADPSHRATPYEFVDALLRGGAPVSSLTLDFTGRSYVPTAGERDDDASVSETAVDLIRVVEAWRRFDLPLHVAVDAASGERAMTAGGGESAVTSTLADTLRRCAGVAGVELDRSGGADAAAGSAGTDRT